MVAVAGLSLVVRTLDLSTDSEWLLEDDCVAFELTDDELLVVDDDDFLTFVLVAVTGLVVAVCRGRKINHPPKITKINTITVIPAFFKIPPLFYSKTNSINPNFTISQS